MQPVLGNLQLRNGAHNGPRLAGRCVQSEARINRFRRRGAALFARRAVRLAQLARVTYNLAAFTRGPT